MHPLLSSRTNFLLYLAIWIPLGAMVGLVLSHSADFNWRETLAITAPLTLLLACACLTPWYSCRFLPLGSTPAWKLLTNHLLAAIVLSGVCCRVALLVASAAAGAFPGLLNAPRIEERFHAALPVLVGMSILLYLLAIALHYVLLVAQSRRQAEVLAREAELKALKAQINPHFLFNSLNSISALTAVDAQRARDMCIRLSDFLRSSLRMGERASIPFSEELALARNYLDVEQVRFGKKLRVIEEIEEGCGDCEVPPLLVQPLVENAIKHGIATMVEGGEISMRSRCSREGLRFVIENPYDPDSPSPRRNGIGLANVRNRLEARYGNAARIEVQAEKDRYRVILLLPCDAAGR